MLPEITLKDVSRDDVDRIAWWLEDTELSSKWFGHYGCGDPVHRGYDPHHMLEAPQSEWQHVFGDSSRLIYSVYDENNDHIGECQLILDNLGGAEVSVLIGRKNLWHRGYGIATAMVLMEKVFTELSLDRAWVSIPQDNTAAMSLFKKLSFVQKSTRELCKQSDGTSIVASVLEIEASVYLALQTSKKRSTDFEPVVTITGMPGSASDEVGREIGRIIGSKFVSEDIRDDLAQRLKSSPNEIESFERGFRSVWTRILASIAMPTEWSTAYDSGYQAYQDSVSIPSLTEDHITQRQYTQSLSGVIKHFAAQGNVILHDWASHIFAPAKPNTITVFVSESIESRAERVSYREDLTLEESMRWVMRADKDMQSHHKHLLKTDALNMAHYDITVNLDRLSIEAAARMVVGSLNSNRTSIREDVKDNQSKISIPA